MIFGLLKLLGGWTTEFASGSSPSSPGSSVSNFVLPSGGNLLLPNGGVLLMP